MGADVVASQGDSRVAETHSGADGSFSLTLHAGTYTITATESGGLQNSAVKVVRVPQQGLAGVTITVDSGIR